MIYIYIDGLEGIRNWYVTGTKIYKKTQNHKNIKTLKSSGCR